MIFNWGMIFFFLAAVIYFLIMVGAIFMQHQETLGHFLVAVGLMLMAVPLAFRR